ncbi:ATP-binding protein [Actinomadura sp. 6N118]|uniref:ATP-binding protein n=1 Tax=Actinomadura sp. 6N118 TaxID=3375151 RepID=UPI003793867A
MLYGRTTEQQVVGDLLDGARNGVSGVLVVRGEPGIGKSALLDVTAEGAGDLRVLRGLGIESEAQLPFAGLHLILRPALHKLEQLPEPQQRALEGAFGLGPAVPADRMLVGLAVLTLLAELADETPLLCLVDDAQWLDRPSAEALLFAARRLGAEPVAVIFAVREGETPFPTPGLPELRLSGLGPADAAALVDDQAARLSPEVRYRVLAEAEGNPLALIELPAALTAGASGLSLNNGLSVENDLSAGNGLSARNGLSAEKGLPPGPSLPLTGRLQAAFHGQVARLPAATRAMLLVAAADSTGELAVVLAAAKSASAAELHDLPPALDAGLVRLDEVGRRLSFRHPLVRAAVYQGAPLDRRLAAHRALADALTGTDQAGRRAWHLATAATGPDEHAAAELARAAAQAAQRNGHSAAAAAYERAAGLTADRAEQGRLLTQAAESAIEAGELRSARSLAERAQPQVTDPLVDARLVLVLAAAHAGEGALRASHELLLAEVARIRKDDPHGAITLLMEAFGNVWFGGDRDMAIRTAAQLDEIKLDPDDRLRPVRELQDWIVSLVIGRATDRLPPMGSVVAAAREIYAGHTRTLMEIAGLELVAGRDAEAYGLSAEIAAESRAKGHVGTLPAALYHVAVAQATLGRYRDALASASEADTIGRDTGQWRWASLANGLMAYLAAMEGDDQRCRDLAARARTEAAGRIFSPGAARAEWALALLDLGGGRAEATLKRLEDLGRSGGRHQLASERSTPDMIEAAVRIGEPARVAETLTRFEAAARRIGRPPIDALAERCRALLSPDDRAGEHYITALRWHEQDSRPFEHARTELLYGEWLRRARRKSEAREHLRAALEMFDRIDARPWAERANTELDATGLAVKHRQAPGPLSRLTPQELQIVRLAAQGLSNRDIAAQLFLSPRTVGHHLYKAYPKLGVASRGELAALPLND